MLSGVSRITRNAAGFCPCDWRGVERFQRAQSGGGQIARDAINAAAIGAVRGQVDFDDRIVVAADFGKAFADRRVGGQFENAVMFSADAEFIDRAHSMPCDSTPRMVPFFRASPVSGMTSPGRASTTLMPAPRIGRAAHDLQFFLAGIYGADAQTGRRWDAERPR